MIVTLAAAAAVAGVSTPVRSGKVHKAEIREFEFVPAVLQVSVGDRIAWTNLDVVPHTATAKDESWDTGKLNQGEQVEVLVTADFAENYFCRYHPSMEARIEHG